MGKRGLKTLVSKIHKVDCLIIISYSLSSAHTLACSSMLAQRLPVVQNIASSGPLDRMNLYSENAQRDFGGGGSGRMSVKIWFMMISESV